MKKQSVVLLDLLLSSANISVKSRVVNIIALATTQFCHCTREPAKDSMSRNEPDCVPIKLYLWRFKFECYIIFMSPKGLLFSQPFTHTKLLWTCGPYRSRCWAELYPWAMVC